MLGHCALPTSKLPGQSVQRCQTKPKSTYLPPFAVSVSVCRFHCGVSIQITAPSSSMISFTATATMNRSPSPAVERAKRTSAYVEQKNWSVVRRAVGYYRYDTPEQLDLLKRLYAVMHFYVNFFIPVTKLEEKTRVGSRVKRVHDDPQTPYARVLVGPDISEEHKAQLRETYALLDLVDLRRQINELQSAILDTVSTQ